MGKEMEVTLLQCSFVGLLVETRVSYRPRDIWAISETGVVLIDFFSSFLPRCFPGS